ncbi:MAG: Ribosome association toxin RatA [Pseudomonadota bacterium]|jgi:ribosome-associated toxin RatA of RatAB toxin-antitoxin module
MRPVLPEPLVFLGGVAMKMLKKRALETLKGRLRLQGAPWRNYNQCNKSYCMKKLIKSVLIWYSPEEMFRLVTDVDQYMHFLPWCNHSKVLHASGTEMDAEVGIGMAGIKQVFVTHNTHIENSEVHMKLVKGPFSDLDGTWRFEPVGDNSQRACKVTLTLEYGFSSATLAAVVGPVFDKIAASLVDAFVKRAEHVYGAETA